MDSSNNRFWRCNSFATLHYKNLYRALNQHHRDIRGRIYSASIYSYGLLCADAHFPAALQFHFAFNSIMFSVSNGQNRKLDMSGSTSQKSSATFLTVCFPNNTKEYESFLKNARTNQTIKWQSISFDINEAPASLLLIFRAPKGADKSFNGFCQEAGLFMVPRGPRLFYLTEPSGAVELGSCMKSVILREVGGVRKRMQCAHNPPPGKLHLCLPVACTSSGLFQSTPQEAQGMTRVSQQRGLSLFVFQQRDLFWDFTAP